MKVSLFIVYFIILCVLFLFLFSGEIFFLLSYYAWPGYSLSECVFMFFLFEWLGILFLVIGVVAKLSSKPSTEVKKLCFFIIKLTVILAIWSIFFFLFNFGWEGFDDLLQFLRDKCK